MCSIVCVYSVKYTPYSIHVPVYDYRIIMLYTHVYIHNICLIIHDRYDIY